MAPRIPSSFPSFRLTRGALLAVGVCAAVAGCGGQLPASPGSVLTISGYVYQQGTPAAGEPMLAGVLITVEQAEAPARTAKTDSVGFYTVVVRGGAVSITASKTGYASRASMFELSTSTVLNFSLTPSEQ